MNTAPAKLPALRGIHWFVEAWRAALKKPLLWLPAALVVTAAHTALLMEFHRELVEIDGGPGAFMALVFEPVPHLSAMLPLAALFSSAARRHFLPAFSGTHPLRRLIHALALAACGTPFFTALSHAARAALQPASLVHAAALAALSIAAIALHDALTPNIPNTLLLALLAAAIYAFALDALITPWLMARDMFKAAEE